VNNVVPFKPPKNPLMSLECPTCGKNEWRIEFVSFQFETPIASSDMTCSCGFVSQVIIMFPSDDDE